MQGKNDAIMISQYKNPSTFYKLIIMQISSYVNFKQMSDCLLDWIITSNLKACSNSVK